MYDVIADLSLGFGLVILTLGSLPRKSLTNNKMWNSSQLLEAGKFIGENLVWETNLVSNEMYSICPKYGEQLNICYTLHALGNAQ